MVDDKKDDVLKEHQEHVSSRRGKKSKFWIYASAVMAVLLVGSFYFEWGCACSGITGFAVMDKDKAADKAVDYINTVLLQGSAVVDLVSVEEVNGIYAVKIDLEGREIDSYITKDGHLLFPQGFDLDEVLSDSFNQDPVQQDVPKSDKPVVEVFVMSHCPYGTQIEKGIIPVMEALKDKADISIKFCDYAMHGKTEVDEQLSQYCINKEFSSEYLDYMKCFLEAGDSAGCVKKVGLDEAKLQACVSAVDIEFNVTSLYNDRSTWVGGSFPAFPVHEKENQLYGVQGSPTLVINGEQVSSGRDAASLLKAICSAFNTEPAECEAVLSSASPSPGFGFSTTSAGTADAGCGV